jgi:hypothetical protein
MDERDITLVAAAFDRLMATLERTCDTATCWTIASAKDDVIDILAGDWHADEDDQRDEDSRRLRQRRCGRRAGTVGAMIITHVSPRPFWLKRCWTCGGKMI